MCTTFPKLARNISTVYSDLTHGLRQYTHGPELPCVGGTLPPMSDPVYSLIRGTHCQKLSLAAGRPVHSILGFIFFSLSLPFLSLFLYTTYFYKERFERFLRKNYGSLKVVTNEKRGGSRRWQVLEDGTGPWRSMSVYFSI